MIPLSLVTGFLGSGKTTLLRRVIERTPRRRLAYITETRINNGYIHYQGQGNSEA